MPKLTLILDPNKKIDIFEEIKLAELRKIKFTNIAYSSLPGDYLCMVIGNDFGKPRKKKGDQHG